MNLCERCGRPATERHHIFNASMRKKSEEYGAVIWLCRSCHEFYHRNEPEYRKLKAKWQRKIMKERGMTVDEWREIFHKSYL